MKPEYGVAKYNMRDAAIASGFSLNTLRSLYGRGHFRIVGGEAKKGRGFSAELTFEDVMCIAVAKVAVDAGVHPRLAFAAAADFAYSASGHPNRPDRDPSGMYPSGWTVLVMQPALEISDVLHVESAIGFTDLFAGRGTTGRPAAVSIALNDVERNVFSGLDALAELTKVDAD